MVLARLFGGGDGRSRKVSKAEKKITNMYIQPGDRQYYLDQLRQEGSEDAARALLKRFNCSCENTTVDRDEKEMSYRFLVAMGTSALGPVKKYLQTVDKGVNWPFRALRDMIDEEELVRFLIDVLKDIGPEYVRDPERKEQLVLTAAEFPDPELTRAVLPYLDDDNETIRFIAAETIITHGQDFAVSELEKRLLIETSPRTINHIVEAFARHEWKLENPEAVAEMLPAGYKIIRDNTIKKK